MFLLWLAPLKNFIYKACAIVSDLVKLEGIEPSCQ